MFSQKIATKFTEKSYSEKIKKASELLENADNIIIGVGAGLTASGGINYLDTEHFKQHYPQYYKQGYKNIMDVMGKKFWNINEDNAQEYWAFWATHINHVRYQTELLQPYKRLYNICKDKDHFIISTNVDGQLEKAGFNRESIFAPQGDYAYFQCSTPCSYDIYYNEEMIKTMLENKIDEYTIRKEDIPLCPNCGEYLIPNLRSDNTFVEKPHMKNSVTYQKYIDKIIDNNVVLLELGVGFNTPVIIRFPFERLAERYSNFPLIRVNLDEYPSGTSNLLEINEDINKVLTDISV